MRWAAVFVILAFAGVAQAQDVRPQLGLGAYRLGMSADEARALEPGAAWRVLHEGEPTTMLLGAAPVTIDGASFAPLLSFSQGRLARVDYARGFPVAGEADCVGALRSAVQGLETRGAPLSGAAAPWEVGAPVASRTGMGSQMRVFPADRDARIHGFANKRGRIFLQVESVYGLRAPASGGPPAPSCTLIATFIEDPLPALAGHWRADAPSAAALASASVAAHVTWTERPSADDFARFYPTIAMERGIEGQATLDCLIGAEGRLTCAVSAETPASLGFGQAAIDLSHRFRAALMADGAPTPRKRVRVPITFRLD